MHDLQDPIFASQDVFRTIAAYHGPAKLLALQARGLAPQRWQTKWETERRQHGNLLGAPKWK